MLRTPFHTWVWSLTRETSLICLWLVCASSYPQLTWLHSRSEARDRKGMVSKPRFIANLALQAEDPFLQTWQWQSLRLAVHQMLILRDVWTQMLGGEESISLTTFLLSFQAFSQQSRRLRLLPQEDLRKTIWDLFRVFMAEAIQAKSTTAILTFAHLSREAGQMTDIRPDWPTALQIWQLLLELLVCKHSKRNWCMHQPLPHKLCYRVAKPCKSCQVGRCRKQAISTSMLQSILYATNGAHSTACSNSAQFSAALAEKTRTITTKTLFWSEYQVKTSWWKQLLFAGASHADRSQINSRTGAPEVKVLLEIQG